MVSDPVGAFALLYENEVKARDRYLHYMNLFDDIAILQKLKEIKEQEEAHMEIVKEMLNIAGRPSGSGGVGAWMKKGER